MPAPFAERVGVLVVCGKTDKSAHNFSGRRDRRGDRRYDRRHQAWAEVGVTLLSKHASRAHSEGTSEVLLVCCLQSYL
jgi:hypothetical protein